ncbi:MAG: hypothetical protein AAGA35_00065 [Patescibacteria group bacterium]
MEEQALAISKRAQLLVWGLFLLLLAGMAGFAWLYYIERAQPADSPAQEPVLAEPNPIAPLQDLRLQRQFVNGEHRFSGLVTLPTPCFEVREEVIVAESFPEQVSIDLSLESTSDFCTQVLTPYTFTFVVAVSENASFIARFNQVAVPIE